jgi:Zn-dependent protease with chaperone function
MKPGSRTSVVGRGSLVVGLTLALLSAAAAPANATIIGRSTEISLGREAAQEFERTAIVDNDPFLTAKVRRIGARLVNVCDEPSYPYEFHFVDSGVVNAFALPGGFIYLYRGLLQLLPNDDALAFVMAHEITHVTRRHSVRQLEKNLLISTLLNALIPSNSGAQVLELVLGMHYSRQDETDADTRGLVVMAKAGFDPTQGAEAMRVIRRAAGSGRGIPKLLRSHPLPDDRIARLTKQAAEIKEEYARHAPPPDPDAPTPAERLAALPAVTIPGLEGVTVASCRYFPLKTDARWRYRTSGEAGSGRMTVTVLEMVPGNPKGVYRLETSLGRGVAAVQWIATTSDRVLRREPAGDRWLTDYSFPTLADAGEAAACCDWHPATSLASSPQVSPAAPPLAPDQPVRSVGELSAGHVAAAPPRAPDRPVAEEFRAVAQETLRVPAGEFQTLKIECLAPTGEVTATCWFAPGVGLVKRVSAKSGMTQELESLYMPHERPGGAPPVTAAGDAPEKDADRPGPEPPAGEPVPSARPEPVP